MRETNELRSTLDLIRELEDEAARFWVCAIVVGFESKSGFVWSYEGTERDRLNSLNQMVASGGEPMGMVGVIKDERTETLTFASRLLAEYAGEPWAHDYLETLMETVVTLAKEFGNVEDWK